MHDAFQSGVKMMDKFYDRVTYNFDDSDDETGGGCQKRYEISFRFNSIF